MMVRPFAKVLCCSAALLLCCSAPRSPVEDGNFEADPGLFVGCCTAKAARVVDFIAPAVGRASVYLKHARGNKKNA